MPCRSGVGRRGADCAQERKGSVAWEAPKCFSPRDWGGGRGAHRVQSHLHHQRMEWPPQALPPPVPPSLPPFSLPTHSSVTWAGDSARTCCMPVSPTPGPPCSGDTAVSEQASFTPGHPWPGEEREGGVFSVQEGPCPQGARRRLRALLGTGCLRLKSGVMPPLSPAPAAWP